MNTTPGAPTDAQIDTIIEAVDAPDHQWWKWPTETRDKVRRQVRAAILSLHPAPSAAEPGASEPVGWLYPTDTFFVRGAERPDERASWRPLYDHPAPSAAQGLSDAEKATIQAEHRRNVQSIESAILAANKGETK